MDHGIEFLVAASIGAGLLLVAAIIGLTWLGVEAYLNFTYWLRTRHEHTGYSVTYATGERYCYDKHGVLTSVTYTAPWTD